MGTERPTGRTPGPVGPGLVVCWFVIDRAEVGQWLMAPALLWWITEHFLAKFSGLGILRLGGFGSIDSKHDGVAGWINEERRISRFFIKISKMSIYSFFEILEENLEARGFPLFRGLLGALGPPAGLTPSPPLPSSSFLFLFSSYFSYFLLIFLSYFLLIFLIFSYYNNLRFRSSPLSHQCESGMVPRRSVLAPR